MDNGFYHPDRGYWQAIDVADNDHLNALLATYPEGTTQVPIKPGADYVWVDWRWEYVAPTEPVPDQVSPAQAEIALFKRDNGALLAQVNATIEAYPYEPVRIWWRKATYISRTHPYLEALALELGLSDPVVDELFIAAAKL